MWIDDPRNCDPMLAGRRSGNLVCVLGVNDGDVKTTVLFWIVQRALEVRAPEIARHQPVWGCSMRIRVHVGGQAGPMMSSPESQVAVAPRSGWPSMVFAAST
jgi:hypothetical protein